MNSCTSPYAEAEAGLQQMVRRPRESDGVGNALRQIFGGSPGPTSDFTALLSRLNKQD